MNDNQAKSLASIEMPDPETPFDLEVGVTYQGSFKINKAGEIKVRPYQKGSKPTNLKKTIEGDNHVIYISKNLVRVVFSIPRTDEKQILDRFREILLEAYKDLSEIAL